MIARINEHRCLDSVLYTSRPMRVNFKSHTCGWRTPARILIRRPKMASQELCTVFKPEEWFTLKKVRNNGRSDLNNIGRRDKLDSKASVESWNLL